MFQLGRHQTTKGNHHRPGPLDLGAGPVLDQHQPRADLRPAAADLGDRASRRRRSRRTSRTPCARPRPRPAPTATVSEANDNNAIMAQLLLHGTNFVNFVGLNAWIGLEGGFEAVRVTEWDEPQAVIGSYLHRYAYPDFWRLHVERNKRELIELDARPDLRPQLQRRDPALEEFANVIQGTAGRCAACSIAANICTSPRAGAASWSTTSPASATRACRSGSSPRPSRRSATTRVSTPATRPAWRCRPTSRSRRTATIDGEHPAARPTRNISLLEEQSGAALPPDLQLCGGHRRRGGPDPGQRQHLADGEPRNNFLAPRGDLERERRARTAPGTSRWPAVTPTSPPMPGWSWSTSTIRSPAPAATRAAQRRPRLGGAVPLPLGDRRRRPQAVRRHRHGQSAAGAGRDGAARRRPRGLSRPHLRLCRRQAAGPGDRQHHQSRAAAPPIFVTFGGR